jgi:hypothetical protein
VKANLRLSEGKMAQTGRVKYNWQNVPAGEAAKQQNAQAPSATPTPQTLTEWMFEMYGWAHRVRKDILRLEAAGKLAAGDPGSPPLPPPPPEDLNLTYL